MGTAVAAHHAGKMAECDALCQSILALDPRHTEARLLSGIVAAKMGRTEAAIERLRQVVQVDSRSFAAFNWLAMLLRESDRVAEATECAERAVSLVPSEPDALNNLAMCYVRSNRSAEAVGAFSRAISIRPHQPLYHYGLATALDSLNRTQEAVEALEKAIRLSPDPSWMLQLGTVLLGEGQALKAAKICRRALDIEPNLALAHLLLSQALEDLGESDEAKDHFDSAIVLQPQPHEIYKIRGLRRQSIGQFQAARDDFQRSIEIEPSQGFAYYGLVSSARVTEDDRPLLAKIEQVIQTGRVAPSEAAYLHFALGKALDNLGDYAGAMDCFDEANRLVREARLLDRPFDRERMARRIDDTIALFCRERMSHALENATDSELPVFVVGMMRSGTTLLEQILSSHPEVGGAGEQSFWVNLQPSAVDFEGKRIDETAIVEGGPRFCRLMHELTPDRRFVIDKNPANFFALGSIHLGLPRARIIHMIRHPVDTCLSIYMTPIRNPADFGCDRSNIVFAYRQYLRLMAHWRSVLPSDRFLEVRYEDLVQDRQAATKQIVGFCGLEWDEGCMHPEENIRSVRTPSFWQVRQPVYTTSLDRWKRYEKVLGPFTDLLEP